MVNRVLLLSVLFRMRQRRRNLFFRQLTLLRSLLIILQLLQQGDNHRGLHCRIVGHGDRFFSKILRRDERATKANLRVNSNTLQRVYQLCRNLPKRSGWTIECHVIVFLFWMACGTSFRVVSQCFDIPRSTVHRIVHRIRHRMVALLPEIVRLPSEEDLDAIGLGFARKARSAVFRQCVGAIDGCHIRIVCPRNLHEQYYNRKQFYSLNLQALVNDCGKFIDIVSGYPGSVHDSRVLRNSRLYNEQLYPPEGFFILGDGGYPCWRNPVAILTPYRNPDTHEKRAFNNALSRARVVVEQAFGRLKVRWRIIFTKALEVSVNTAIKVIAVCTMLHNICISEGDVIRVDGDLPALPPRRNPRDEEDGNAMRDLFFRIFTIEQNNYNV